MRKATLIRLTSLLVIVTAIAATLLITLHRNTVRPGTVRYHRQRLDALRRDLSETYPSGFSDYFRARTWFWYLNGKPSTRARATALEREQQALIDLGYFERREFVLQDRKLDLQFQHQFYAAVSNSTLADPGWLLVLPNSPPTMLRITACRKDMPAFERIIAELDTAE